MCGICGIAGRSTDEPPLAVMQLHAMTGVIAHRGPDDDGHHLAPGIAMGMRRLSVIDLESGRQPVANERRDIWAVHNGEIFNFEELRIELGKRGHRFSSAGDTETIVHLYEETRRALPRTPPGHVRDRRLGRAEPPLDTRP